MPATTGVRVKGFRELQRAFKQSPKDLRRESQKSLRDIGRIVADDAERFADSRIRNIGGAWSQMRVGVTQRLVYVAPKQRGTRNTTAMRPNLAPLLMDRAMQPALDENRDEVDREFGHMLDRVVDRWGRG